jgi:hypothetical protein
LQPQGWWYQDAPEMSTTLDIANYFQSSFLTQKTPAITLLGVPLFPYHQTPKTLSIVDLNIFESSFLVAWEALSKELTNLLKNGDPEIEIKLGRARSQAFAFQLVSICTISWKRSKVYVLLDLKQHWELLLTMP